MKHDHKDYCINLAGGFVFCEYCEREFFFTDIGLTVSDIIQAGNYDKNDPHDKEMIKFFKERQKEKVANK